MPAAGSSLIAGQPWQIVYWPDPCGAKIAQGAGADLAATAFSASPAHA